MGAFFEVTPRDLIADGLYNDLAVGCHSNPHRQVSLALLAKALGATHQTVDSSVRVALSRLAGRTTAKAQPSMGDDVLPPPRLPSGCSYEEPATLASLVV